MHQEAAPGRGRAIVLGTLFVLAGLALVAFGLLGRGEQEEATPFSMTLTRPPPTPEAEREPVPHSGTVGGEVDLPSLVAQAKPAVVTLYTFDRAGNPVSQGTGFFTSSTEIITNRHVVAGAYLAEAKLASGDKVDVKGLLADDEARDLALLEVEMPTTPPHPLPLAIDLPREGESVLVIGSPHGLEQTLSEGIVSAVRDLDGFGKLIQISAPISPGSSGSPVLDTKGKVVGVATSQMEDGQALNFAVPATEIRALSGTEIVRLDRWATKVSEQEKAHATARRIQGLCAFAAEDYGVAVEHFKASLEDDTNDPTSWAYLGRAYRAMGETEQALTALRRARELAAGDALIHLDLAGLYQKVGLKSEAHASFLDAERASPEDAALLIMVGSALLDAGRHQDAARCLEKAYRLKPETDTARELAARAHFALGVEYSELGDHQRALRAFQAANGLNPYDPATHVNIGICHLRLERWRTATRAFRRAVDLAPDDAGAYVLLGYASLQARDRTGAENALGKLRELDPERADMLAAEIRRVFDALGSRSPRDDAGNGGHPADWGPYGITPPPEVQRPKSGIVVEAVLVGGRVVQLANDTTWEVAVAHRPRAKRLDAGLSSVRVTEGGLVDTKSGELIRAKRVR